MRIPGWAFILGILALVGSTLVCGVVSFGFTRQLVIDMSAQGISASSPIELISYVVQGADALKTPQVALVDENVPTSTAVPTLIVSNPTATLPGSTPAPTTEASLAVPTATIDPLLDNPILNDPRRQNILILGIDQRDAVQDPGPFRTDTMILVTVDPVRKTAGVISIPRDLWVTIPGYEAARINTANSTGDANAYPGGGGPALAAATVSANLGIPVDKYILVNFHVFTTIVDIIAPDGIEIEVTEVIDDPKYPDAGLGTMHIHFDPGLQRLNAEQLLQYARTRATFGGDFDRARRQQQVIEALRAHVLSLGGIGTFVTQAPAIWDELKDSYKTNLTLGEIIGLGLLMNDIPRENIQYEAIDNHYVDLAKNAAGDDILLLRQGAVSDLIQRVFNPQPDLTLADLKTRADAEAATILVYNNTDISGLATQTSEWLQSRGVSVLNVGNMPTPSNAGTVIRYYTGKEWTARYLAALLNLPLDRIEPGSDRLTTEDIVVVVGPDIQPLLSGQ